MTANLSRQSRVISVFSVDGQRDSHFAFKPGVPKALRDVGRYTQAVVTDRRAFLLSYGDRFLLDCHWT